MEEHKASPRLKMVYIGNSFTYFNDLPSMLQDLTSGAVETAGSVLKGGQTLKGHSEDPRTESALQDLTFTHLVLQGQSSNPGLLFANDEKLREKGEAVLDVVKGYFAKSVADNALKNTNLQSVVFYSTWGHRGPCVYKTLQKEYPNFKVMVSKIQQSYRVIASEFTKQTKKLLVDAGEPAMCPKVIVAPVGRAFDIVYDLCKAEGVSDPETDPACLFYRLYAPDAFHPSRLGTYLVACVFYGTLFGKDPRGLQWYPSNELTNFDRKMQAPDRFGADFKPENFDQQTAACLRSAAYAAVFNSPGAPEAHNHTAPSQKL